MSASSPRLCTGLLCFTLASLRAAPTRATEADAVVDTDGASDRGEAFRLSLVGSLRPALGDAKRDALDLEGPEIGSAYGVRMELRVHDWWLLGAMLTRTHWSIANPPSTAGGPFDGEINSASASLRFEPLRFDTALGTWSFHALAHLGAALPTDERRIAVATRQGPGDSPSRELVDGGGESLEAGYVAGGYVGMSYFPWRRLGVFLDAGIDWHHALYLRGIAGSSGAPESTQSLARLWLGQTSVNLGAAFRF